MGHALENNGRADGIDATGELTGEQSAQRPDATHPSVAAHDADAVIAGVMGGVAGDEREATVEVDSAPPGEGEGEAEVETEDEPPAQPLRFFLSLDEEQVEQVQKSLSSSLRCLTWIQMSLLMT